jgi:hypothetical protein
MLSGIGAPNKTQKCRKWTEFEKVCELQGAARYRKAGMNTTNFADDSTRVNVHELIPSFWVKSAMLFLNLVVWLDAGVQLV